MSPTYVLALFMIFSTATGAELCPKPADVAFIIDSSSSIWYKYFTIQLEFVKKLIKTFKINPTDTQVAALTFSKNVVKQFNFKDFNNLEDVLEKVSTITQDNGNETNTHKALEKALSDLFAPGNGVRENVPRICILLTDGVSTYHTATLAAAQALKDAGIKIITVGIGHKINIKELEAIASSPAKENVFKVEKFEDLKTMGYEELVGKQACPEPKTTTTTTTTPEPTTTTTTTTATTTQTCQGKEADMVFIVDSSSSIWNVDFETQKTFIGDVISHFDVESGKTRVALIAFSDEAAVKIHLNQYNTRKELISAIATITQPGGSTNTHLALELMLREVFSTKNGARPGAAHIAVVITDGVSSRPDQTMQQIELTRKSGVYVFTVGVGNKTDKSELEAMASKPVSDFSFVVDGYASLRKFREILAFKTCKVPGDQPTCSSDFMGDLMFGIHGIGGDSMDHVIEFIKHVGGAFKNSKNIRLGLKESCRNADLPLSDYSADSDFATNVQEQMVESAADLLSGIRTSFGNVRPDVNRVSVLILSGKIDDMEKAFLEAMRLKYSTRVIVVGVGKSIDREQLMRLASYEDKAKPDISHVFPVDSSAELSDIVKKLHVLICRDSE
ncbi:collagen alpha-5(VI) chain-like isoform X2 [Dreissena polymorpha]|uniref:collagen alpha-5(VI) chain-like isoform X2 n=1 Tax=Dreissena polymorpha TaxID=45954 RepID=UPI002263E533|nr:collagen alpha-5(VI) chain-like isoform X2 [Dreissena polymorpha]